MHGAICQKAGILIDVFSPIREDFMEQYQILLDFFDNMLKLLINLKNFLFLTKLYIYLVNQSGQPKWKTTTKLN